LFGPAAGTITALLDALIICLRNGHLAREPFRLIFNISAVALTTRLSGEIFFGVAGIPPYSVTHTPLAQILLPLLLFTLSYFLLNSWLVTVALAIEQDQPALAIWRDNFLWLSVNYVGGGSVAALLVTYTREIDFTTLGIIIPLLLISYLTFKTSLGRIEDANLHLTQVNRMYLSTIETLAMAIDAKDQITHGHIRRVQRLAVGLAKAMGVKDDTQIKAIEAAALLHDMGKLAIPEFILNKPGKLTSKEFDVIKQHANIGADILSSIHFPYPVVPIVRHHHESWDGSGYPDNLKGVSIPIGARILSVVDCFDALTSDRPYRPKLSAEDATAILLQRRGTMYDPLVVDRFVDSQEQLCALASDDATDTDAIDSIATKLRVVPDNPSAMVAITSDRLPIKALRLLRSLKPLPQGLSVADLGVIASQHLSGLANVSALAVYCITERHRSLICRYADGALAPLENVFEIGFGEKLSGFVVAHNTPIWNSDATLDLAVDVAQSAGLALGSSIPLVDGDKIVGALTLYSAAGQEISLEQRLLIQSVAPFLASSFSAAIEHDNISAIDGTSQCDREALYAVLDGLLSQSARVSGFSELDAPVIVRVNWLHANERSQLGQAMLRRDLAAITDGLAHVVLLSSSELLVTAPLGMLGSIGLVSAAHTVTGTSEVRVAQVSNSLQLREALGLTFPNDLHLSSKPLIH
jgi:putative nucleotidyltransferase with HDIG domain